MYINYHCESCGRLKFDSHTLDSDPYWKLCYGCRDRFKNWRKVTMCIEEKKVKDCTRTELETYLADQEIEEAFNKLAGVIKELRDKGFTFPVNQNTYSKEFGKTSIKKGNKVRTIDFQC